MVGTIHGHRIMDKKQNFIAQYTSVATRTHRQAIYGAMLVSNFRGLLRSPYKFTKYDTVFGYIVTVNY